MNSDRNEAIPREFSDHMEACPSCDQWFDLQDRISDAEMEAKVLGSVNAMNCLFVRVQFLRSRGITMISSYVYDHVSHCRHCQDVVRATEEVLQIREPSDDWKIRVDAIYARANEISESQKKILASLLFHVPSRALA